MNFHKSAYELSQAQVTTPIKIVSLFWQLTKGFLKAPPRVLDLGAGDCRFAQSSNYAGYTGVEIDKSKTPSTTLPDNANLIHDCAFRYSGTKFYACIGNPPYVRHHDIENPWKTLTAKAIEAALAVKLDLHCNLYLYFLCLGIMKSKADGIVSLVIPYEMGLKALRKASSRPRRAREVKCECLALQGPDLR